MNDSRIGTEQRVMGLLQVDLINQTKEKIAKNNQGIAKCIRLIEAAKGRPEFAMHVFQLQVSKTELEFENEVLEYKIKNLSVKVRESGLAELL